MRPGAWLLLAVALLFTGCAGGGGSSSNNTGSTGTTTTTPTNVVSAAAATRFLEQSTFGPTPGLIAQVQASGFAPFLSTQFAAAGSTYPDPAAGVNTLT